jgi:hypothetical protein
MKKYSILFVTAALLTSCSDWLDITPKDKTLEDDLFATHEGIYSANTGLYREMIGGNLYGRNLSQTTVDVMGHVMTYSSAPTMPSPEDGNVRSNWALANFRYTHDNAKGYFTSIWKSSYTALLHINTYIKKLNESPVEMTDQEKNVLLGEAYGLRAYLHFDLFRLFGPIWKDKNNSKILPYHNKADVTMNHTDYEETEYSTADEYMSLLWDDIRKAQDLLKNDPIVTDDNSITNNLVSANFFQNRNRRMNYYAVKGLEARVRQYCDQHAEAAAAAKEITDLIEAKKRFKWPNVASIVGVNNYIFFGEVIFGINNIDMASQSTTLYEASELRKAYVVDSKNLLENILGYGGSSLESMIDIRARQWVVAEITNTVGVDYSLDGTYRSKKYRKFSYWAYNNDDVDYFPAVENLQVLMRVSEMYYIQAEAALNGGDRGKAAGLLNKVLENRGLTEQYLLTGAETDEEFHAHLEKEYYREFIGEGQVFFFHKRRASTQMFKGYEAGSIAVENPSVNYVVPIPEEETNI